MPGAQPAGSMLAALALSGAPDQVRLGTDL